jgi:hypothetical protein
MSDTELQILRETQAMLDERLKMVDAERAAFLQMDGPTRARSSEQWFRQEIAKALAPILTRIEQLQNRPAPAPARTTFKPPQEFISAIGQTLHDEINPFARAHRDA